MWVYRCTRCGKGVRNKPHSVQETCDEALTGGHYLRFLPLGPEWREAPTPVAGTVHYAPKIHYVLEDWSIRCGCGYKAANVQRTTTVQDVTCTNCITRAGLAVAKPVKARRAS